MANTHNYISPEILEVPITPSGILEHSYVDDEPYRDFYNGQKALFALEYTKTYFASHNNPNPDRRYVRRCFDFADEIFEEWLSKYSNNIME